MEDEKPKLKIRISIDTGKLMKSISSNRKIAIKEALQKAASQIRKELGLPSKNYGILEAEIIENPPIF